MTDAPSSSSLPASAAGNAAGHIQWVHNTADVSTRVRIGIALGGIFLAAIIGAQFVMDRASASTRC